MTIIKTSAIALVMALAAAPSVAQADSEGCSVPISDDFCSTPVVAANPNGNFLHVRVSGPCDAFAVFDVNNGVVVYRASVGWGSFEKTLPYVYSEYSLSIFGGTWPFSNATINN